MGSEAGQSGSGWGLNGMVSGKRWGIRSRDGMTVWVGGRVRNRVISVEALVGWEWGSRYRSLGLEIGWGFGLEVSQK